MSVCALGASYSGKKRHVTEICKVLCTLVNVVIKANIVLVGADIKILVSFMVTTLIQEEISL